MLMEDLPSVCVAMFRITVVSQLYSSVGDHKVMF